MSNQPVYRRPRNHSYACRCSRCHAATARGGEELRVLSWLLGITALVLLAIWPALAVRGSSGRWDTMTTVAECTYWGVILLIAGMVKYSRG
jgi:hypothetical protein